MKNFFYLKPKQILYSAVLLGIFALLIWQSFGVSASITQQETSQKTADKVKDIKDSPVFAEFDDWINWHINNSYGSDNAQIEKGKNLAFKRKELLKQLIEIDPQAALEKTISPEIYQQLPLSIAENSEKPISAYGDFLVYVFDEIDPATGKMTGSRTEREVVIGNNKYKAVVYGRRESMTTKLNIPIQGIVIDGVMIVDENPLRKIEAENYAALAIDESKLNDGVPAEVGGKVKYFSSQSEFDNFVEEQIDWESKIGPERPNVKLEPGEMASPWTEGVKKVLVIRVDFSDRPGEPIDSSTGQPITPTLVQNLFNNQINPFYLSNSFNKTSLQATVTPVVRLPQTQSFYAQDTNYLAMLTDARNTARAAGFETNDFDLDMVVFSYSGFFNFGGLGYIGLKGIWVNGEFNLRVIAHELGHNYGLHHAGLWRTSDGSVIGQGTNDDYGDFFDVMGKNSGNQPFHFNAHYKRLLDWLTDANVQTVTTDGTYRIFAQDSTSSNGIRTLKIKKNNAKNYWVEFRQQITQFQEVMNGALFRWDDQSTGFRQTQLLDMVPDFNVTNAPLTIGKSFLDSENHIKFTVLGKGNTTPESLDIKVELNAGCSFSLDKTNQSISASGGEGVVTVNTQNGCNTQIKSNNSWLYIVSTDSGNVKYMAEANYSSQPRTGTITIGGQTFTVQQSGATTACAPQPWGLVAWWRGEGNALDQVGGNSGTLVNNLSFGGGKVGGGFMGDGMVSTSAAISKKVLIPDSSSLALNQSLTIEGWLRLDSSGQYIIIQRGDLVYSNNPFGSYTLTTTTNRGLWFTLKSSSTGDLASLTSPVGNLPIGQFIHFAATLDHSTGQMKLYKNGNVIAQTITPVRPYTEVDPNRTAIGIGNMPSSNAAFDHFKGIIDELSLYNRALTETEIKSIYNAGTAPTGAAGKCLEATPTIQTTVGTNPTGVSFTVDGVTYSSTQTFSWESGSSHTIATVSPQGNSATRQAWSSWSNGGAISHTVAPTTNTNYTANFTTQHFLTMNAGTGGTVTPQSGWFNAGQSVQISATPNSGNVFNGWMGTGTGSFTGAMNPATVTINGPITESANFSLQCTYAINPASQSFVAGGGAGSFGMTVNTGCNWSAVANAPWITTTSSGSGNGTINFAVAANTGAARSGTLSVGGQTFTVNQAAATSTTNKIKMFDYDGDDKTDISIYRPSLGQWWYLRSSDGANRAFAFGNPSAKIVPADYTGDGKTDIAYFLPSTNEWFIVRSEDNTFYGFPFGAAGDIPIAADFDGDGKADPTVFRPSTQTWFTVKSTGGTLIQQFGSPGDMPVVADYDGDKKADLAIFRPGPAEWWILKSTGGNLVYQFGTTTDKAVPADYTGDGKTDVAFFRPSTGEWFVIRSEDQTFYGAPFGTNGDMPIPGDYDGDGKADFAVYRPSNDGWYINKSTGGAQILSFGQTGDLPTSHAFVQ